MIPRQSIDTTSTVNRRSERLSTGRGSSDRNDMVYTIVLDGLRNERESIDPTKTVTESALKSFQTFREILLNK
jgi:hypothetical protein